MNTMDIHSKPGTKVVFVNPENGSDFDQRHAANHLELGKEYTVSNVCVSSWSASVWLEEVDGTSFNSVMFAAVEQEDEPPTFDHATAVENAHRATKEWTKLLDELIAEDLEEHGFACRPCKRQKVLDALGDEVLSTGWDQLSENMRIRWVLALLRAVA